MNFDFSKLVMTKKNKELLEKNATPKVSEKKKMANIKTVILVTILLVALVMFLYFVIS